MKQSNYRVIYMLESYTESGDLVYRLFAANKRTAEKMIRERKGSPAPVIRKLSKSEHCWIAPNAVDRF